MTVSLVPRGQPQGKRQENEAAAAEAGLTQTRALNPPRQLPSVPRAAVQAPPFEEGSFDALAATEPTQFGNLRGERSPLLDALAQSPHPGLRDIAQRIRGF